MRLLALAACAVLLAGLALAAPAERPAGAPEHGVVVPEAAQPTEIRFAPDGTMLWTELGSGNVRALAPGESPPGQVVAHVDAVAGGNGGLLGLEVDPDWNATRALYVYYTAMKDGERVNRVSRVANGTEDVLLDDVPWAEMHDGGKLLLLPDRTLLVTVGDNERRSPAQDPASPLGKIHRIALDGSTPPDNPTPGSTIYASGVRNPFGLAMDRETGRVWFSENGPTTWDEVNPLFKGANYGWPECGGACGDSRWQDPILAWEKAFGPTGLAFLRGDLYLGDFVNGKIRRIDVTADPAIEDELWAFEGERVLSVTSGPDGASLYVGTLTSIHALRWPDLAPPPAPPTPTPPPPPTPTTPSPTPPPPVASPPTDAPEESRRVPGPAVALLVLVASGTAWCLRECKPLNRARAVRGAWSRRGKPPRARTCAASSRTRSSPSRRRS